MSKQKKRNTKVILCSYCGTDFETRCNTAKFCSKVCRDKHNNDEKYKDKTEGIDYVVCKWCGKKTERIYGQHIKLSHKGKTIDDYKIEFPGAPIYCEADVNNTTVNAGQHMKTEKYKKIFSEKFKGDKNPNHKSKTTEEYRKSLSPFSIHFYLKKGYSKDEAIKLRDEAVIKSNEDKLIPTQLEYWLRKGLSKEDAMEKLSERQSTFTLEKCIDKYGEAKGRERWNERQKKWKDSVFNSDKSLGSGRSMACEDFIEGLYNHIKDTFNEDDILYGINEKVIKDIKTKKAYLYDFCIKSIHKIIEFNGTFWHCKPILYESDYYHKIKKMTAEEIWNYDLCKLNLAKSHGYDVMTVWEDDYTKKPEEVIKKCLEFIYDKVTH